MNMNNVGQLSTSAYINQGSPKTPADPSGKGTGEQSPAAIISISGQTTADQTIPAALDPEEARATLAEELDRIRAQNEHIRQQMESAREQGEAKAEAMRMMAKALEIARRIMMGDNVPAEDHKFLMEFDAALYGKALTMRINRQDPTDYERLSEDESARETDSAPEVNGSMSRWLSSFSPAIPATSAPELPTVAV
ncbi:MAG: hypothetical protein FWE32_06865 [Oscillospiraceae bacterium]|nr:hypothetical protein [Oscillospiraceae bacterium]